MLLSWNFEMSINGISLMKSFVFVLKWCYLGSILTTFINNILSETRNSRSPIGNFVIHRHINLVKGKLNSTILGKFKEFLRIFGASESSGWHFAVAIWSERWLCDNVFTFLDIIAVKCYRFLVIYRHHGDPWPQIL